MASKAPHTLTIRMYKVGFGDCFLLTFEYAQGERHLLIDFGSTGLPKNKVKGDHMMRIAKDIEERTQGVLHALIATHRHADHINGFTTGTPNRPRSGDVIRRLAPKVVVQPWTEDPKAAPNARRGTASSSRQSLMVATLANMNRFAESLIHELERPGTPLSRSRGFTVRSLKQLHFLGMENLPNLSAVLNLQTMASTKRGQKYVCAGDSPGLSRLFPGVKFDVLGPPTIEQSESIRKQVMNDASEFWQLSLDTLSASMEQKGKGTAPVFPGAKTIAAIPPYARWILRRIGALRADQLLELVRTMDEAMNNTSVVMMIQVGGERLLFPGDAQLESWMYILGKDPQRNANEAEAIRKQLAGVSVYKVGHHGSSNATPKSLWSLFGRKGSSAKVDRLRSLLSTQPGKYGNVEAHTEIPRETLVAALAKHTRLHSSMDIKGGQLFEDVVFNLKS